MRFQIFSKRGLRRRQWYWRLKAGNNRIIAVGGEGFNNEADVRSIIETMKRDIASAEIQEP